jgi:hypothetical protein
MNASLKRIAALERERADARDPMTDGESVTFTTALYSAIQVCHDADESGEPVPGVKELICGGLRRSPADIDAMFARWLGMVPPEVSRVFLRGVETCGD